MHRTPFLSFLVNVKYLTSGTIQVSRLFILVTQAVWQQESLYRRPWLACGFRKSGNSFTDDPSQCNGSVALPKSHGLLMRFTLFSIRWKPGRTFHLRGISSYVDRFHII